MVSEMTTWPAAHSRRRRNDHHELRRLDNNHRLHSLIELVTPEEFEHTYYAPEPAHRRATPPTRDGMKSGTVQMRSDEVVGCAARARFRVGFALVLSRVRS
jgi:hypothetical protein